MRVSVKPDHLNWADLFPDIAATEVMVDEHLSEEHFRREVERVFRRTWLFAGMESDLREPGDFVVREFTGLNASIILVRGRDGAVRGFHNACRHRAAKLRGPQDRGNVNRFTCPFHGWSYSTEGALAGLPDQDPYLDKSALGLAAVRTEIWNGFVFVNLEKDERESFEQFLGEMKTHPVNAFPFTAKEWDSWAWRVEVNANWKVVKDLFLETYHVSFVHAATVDKLYSSPDNPFNHPPAIDFFGLHHRLSLGSSPTNKDVKIGPVGLASVKYGGANVSRFGKAKNAAPGLNPDGLQNWGIDTYSIFPNFNVHLFGGLWHYHLFEPIAAEKTVWENRIFFPKAGNAGERFAHAYSRSLQGLVTLEDLSAAERNQEGMKLCAFPTLALHDQEIQLRFLRRVLRQYAAA